MAVQIFIARHGQNEDNARGILNGHRDLPLTATGRQQAGELAEGINGLGLTIDVIYSSPLSRALETAEIIGRNIKPRQKLRVLDEMIERDFGIMTGHPISDIVPMCSPDILVTDVITYFLNPPGAETFPDLLKRAEKILEIIRAKQQSGNILLVCHGDIGKMIYAAAREKDWREVLKNFHFGNGELLHIGTDDSAHLIELTQYNH